MHVGKTYEKYKCQDLKVDRWEELDIYDEEKGIDDIEDVCDGYEIMEEKSEEKYLGDILSSDGKNIKNIKARVAKGKGVISRIMAMIEGIPFGKNYFKVALILRESLLMSSMLFNSEAWYNVTKTEIELLETVDVQFLRQVLRAPRSTPKEMLFLETGCVPFREIIRKKRILFLQYILNEKDDSLLKKFLMKQKENKKPRDWINQVLSDLKELEIEESFETIKSIRKSTLKIMLNDAIKRRAFQDLVIKKESHSKVSKIKHERLEMQQYLKPINVKISIEEAQEMFKMRCRVADVKMNFKGKYENLDCDICNEENETQIHLIECKEINKNEREYEKPPEYEELFKTNIQNQLKLVRKFLKNIKIREKMKT